MPFCHVRRLLLQALLLAWALPLFADTVRNGNELARDYGEGDAAARAKFQKERTGMIHTFRYLAVRSIERPAGGAVRMSTVEPSSDAKVDVVFNGSPSIKLAATISTGDCVAVRGRVKSISTDGKVIVVDPGVLQFKDRAQPTAGEELLREVDPTAK